METFIPGVYQHYKGQYYLALGLAREDETNETVVVYTRLYAREGLPMSTRKLSIWQEYIIDPSTQQPIPRFKFIGQTTPDNLSNH